MTQHITAALFVPGSRPERYAKALATGAELVLVDLEDSVLGTEKALAREHFLDWISGLGAARDRVGLRINPVGSDEFDADAKLLNTLHEAKISLDVVILPKVNSPTDLQQAIDTLLGNQRLVPLIESGAAMINIHAISRHPGVAQLAFGAADYAASLGCSLDPESLLFARSEIVLASSVAGLPAPLDAPCFSLDDVEKIASHAAHGRRIGFGGALCIHPVQVPVIQGEYRPKLGEIEWAEKVLRHETSDGAFSVDGEMIDEPILVRARRILERAMN